MNKIISVHIITRNSHKLLNRLMVSVVSNTFFCKVTQQIVIIDDSNNNGEINKNKHIISKYSSIIPIVYICKNNSSDLFSKSLTKNFKIGIAEWNTGNIRNISMLCAYFFEKSSKYIFNFDDDMIIPKSFSQNISELEKKLQTSPVIGIPLNNCPDFSRLEWIQFYLQYKLIQSDLKYLLSTDYKDFVFSKLSLDQCAQILYRYTNFNISMIHNKKTIEIPKREELNGGSYITNNSKRIYKLFPNWFDEDWAWFYLIRKSKSNVNFISDAINHESRKKNILNLKLLLFEEKGKIHTYYIRNPNTNIKKYIKSRVNLINDEIIYSEILQEEKITKHLVLIKKYLLKFKLEEMECTINKLYESNKIYFQ